MRALLAWTRKEAREHRAFLRLFHLVLPALVLLAAVVLQKDLRGGHSFEVGSSMAAIAVMLSALGVAAGLFATDLDEAAASPAQRLPGALGVALAAKLLLLLVTSLAAAIAALLWASGAVWLLGDPERAWALLTPWAQRDAGWLWSVLSQALAFAGALALVASWVRRPAAAVVGGVLLSAVAAGAVMWFGREHAYAFPRDEPSLTAMGLLALGATLVALSWSWLGGRRRLGSVWGAPVRGLTVVGLSALIAGTSAAATIDRWRDTSAQDPAWRMDWAAVSPDARHAIVLISRPRDRWPLGPESHEPSLVREARHLDLETGAWKRVGGLGIQHSFLPLGPNCHEHFGQLSELAAWPCVALSVPHEDVYEGAWSQPYDTLWVDPVTGTTLHRQELEYTTPRSRELTRQLLGALSTVRDSHGRRTFMLDGFLEREDGRDPVGVPAATKQRPIFPIRPTRGGWTLRFMPGQHAAEFDLIDPDTGASRRIPQPKYGPGRLLSKRYLLTLGSVRRGPYDWRVVDLETGETSPAKGIPDDRSAFVVADEQVLVACPIEGRSSLCLWSPVTGTREPLPWQGERLDEVVIAHAKGPDRNDRWLLRLGDPVKESAGLAVLDMRTRTVRLLSTAPEARAFASELLIRDDGALLRIEREREIVCYGPEAGRREVLFPRPGAAKE